MTEFEFFQRLTGWPTAHQRAYLDGCIGIDPNTRERILELLRLDAGDSNGRIVDERYRLHRQLGNGASSEVWLAYDLRLGRHVALKLLSQALSHRARDEARASAGIGDPHVVQVYDVGESGLDGRAYIAMEFIGDAERGAAKTLADFEELDLEARIRAVEDAAHGVAAAHGVGIIHRDIKPNNIILNPVTERAKVADFGLATSNTLDGYEGGTPPYMAPEQVDGDAIDSRVDIYGLGATLYHVLAGCPPHCSPLPRTPRTVLARVRKQVPEPLSTKAPSVSMRLIRIVETAMARDREQRYAHAMELAQDLEDYRCNRPTSHERRNPLVVLALAIARNKPAIAFVLAASLILGGSLLAITVALVSVNAPWGGARTSAARGRECRTSANRIARVHGQYRPRRHHRFHPRHGVRCHGLVGSRHFAKGTCRTAHIRAPHPRLDQPTTIKLQKAADSVEGGWKIASVEIIVDDDVVYHSGDLDVWLTTEVGLTWTSKPVTVNSG